MARSKSGNGSSKGGGGSIKKLLVILVVVVLALLGEQFSLIDLEQIVSLFENQTATEYVNDEYDTSAGTEVTAKPKVEAGKIQDSTKYTKSKLEIYFFDVGQADCILIVTDGKAMLIDTGNAGDAREDMKLVEGNINLSYELNKLGIEVIHVLVTTHAHEDHMGSMYKILNTFEVKELYTNAIDVSEDRPKYYKRFVTALGKKDVHIISPTTLTEKQIIEKIDEYNATLAEGEETITYNSNDYIRVGDVFYFGNAKITVLAPSSAEYSDDNDYSIVFMLEFEDVKLMLTGDAGKRSEEEILEYASENEIDLDCDILKVGHHGSRTASTEEFIAAVKPEYAIVMVGEGNSYGLPDEDVIERLEKHNAKIYYTMTEGDIKLVIDDGEYEFDLTFTHDEKEE